MIKSEILVSFIIVNFNTEELVIKAIASILENCQAIRFEVIVVDNSSTNTEFRSKLNLIPHVYYWPLGNNVGFGRANNFGFDKSIGDFVFLLNSDAYLLDETTILAMMDFLNENSQVACVGGCLQTEDCNINISFGNFYTPQRAFYDLGLYHCSTDFFHKHLATSLYCSFTKPTAVNYLTAAAIMIKRHVIKELSFFDPDFFMYYEDMELCYRYKKAGYDSVILPQLKIVHLGGQSISTLDNNYLNKEIMRSRYLFLRKSNGVFIASFLYSLFLIQRAYYNVRKALRRIQN